MTLISNAWALLATSAPILPKPSTARVFPRSSAPLSCFLSHKPSRIPVAPRTIARVPHNMWVKVSSAVAMVFPPGVFITMIPFSVAASILILSTPTPARPITLRFLLASITSGEI